MMTVIMIRFYVSIYSTWLYIKLALEQGSSGDDDAVTN